MTPSRTLSPPPDAEHRPPRLQLPSGAWDTHFHVIGPQSVYPLHPDRSIDIADAPVETLLALHRSLGIDYGLLVQSGLHFYDYHHLIHLLTRFGERWRGVAILHEDATDAEIALLGNAGVVGARFYPGVSAITVRQLARVAEHGWSAHVLLRGGEAAVAAAPLLRASRGRVVIEHTGWQDPAEGLTGAGFRAIMDLVETGRVWIKLSPRMSAQEQAPFDDVVPFVRALVAQAPERMLWGSDWPHPNYFRPMPNDAELLDLMLQWVPDESVRKRIFVDNPVEIFGRPTPTATSTDNRS